MGRPKLQVFTLDQTTEWDEIVRSFRKYDVYYLSGYVKGFSVHGDGQPLLFFYEDQQIRGINVVMKRRICECPSFREILDEERYYDLSSPYGYGGWLIEGTDVKALYTEYERWCIRNNIVSEFVRFHPLLENHKSWKQLYEISPMGKTVALDLQSPEIIWENISSKNRNVIRKAVKNGVKIYNGRYWDIFEQFRQIYNSTMDKDQASSYYYFGKEYYRSVLEDLPQNAQIFYAQIPDGKIIAAAILLTANGFMNYHLSGSLQEYSHLAATNLLLYQAALWGYANGCKTLHLGGGVGSAEDGLFKFKRSFYRGELEEFYIGRNVFDVEVYQMLVMMRGETIGNKEYFPLYRG